MTILHIVESFGGGTIHFVRCLTTHLAHHKHIILHGERAEEIDAEKVKQSFPDIIEFYRWKGVQREIHLFKDLKALWYLYHSLRQLKYDAIHLHSSKAGFLGRLACFLTGFKHVYYTPNGAAFARKDISNKKAYLFAWFEKLADFFSGQVISCSESERASFESNNIKTICINNGTDIFDIPDIESNKSKEVFRIVTSGRITAQKNPALFNDIARLFETNKQFEFVWIGQGELSALLTASNIQITGWLTKENITKELLKGDLYLSTSLWEGLPFSVLEAMNLGLPLLLSNCIGNVDLARNGYNGYTFGTAAQAQQFILTLASHPDLLASFRKHSRQICLQEYDISLMAKNYESMYLSGLPYNYTPQVS